MEMWWLGTENPSEQLRANCWGSLGVKPKGREFWNPQGSDPPHYSSLLFQLGTQVPPLSPPSRAPWKFETTSCCRERKFRVNVQFLQCFGGSWWLGLLLLHPLLSSCLSSSFRSREMSEDKQHHKIGGSPMPPSAANVVVPRFIAASELCWYC